MRPHLSSSVRRYVRPCCCCCFIVRAACLAIRRLFEFILFWMRCAVWCIVFHFGSVHISFFFVFLATLVERSGGIHHDPCGRCRRTHKLANVNLLCAKYMHTFCTLCDEDNTPFSHIIWFRLPIKKNPKRPFDWLVKRRATEQRLVRRVC